MRRRKRRRGRSLLPCVPPHVPFSLDIGRNNNNEDDRDNTSTLLPSVNDVNQGGSSEVEVQFVATTSSDINTAPYHRNDYVASGGDGNNDDEYDYHTTATTATEGIVDTEWNIIYPARVIVPGDWRTTRNMLQYISTINMLQSMAITTDDNRVYTSWDIHNGQPVIEFDNYNVI